MPYITNSTPRSSLHLEFPNTRAICLRQGLHVESAKCFMSILLETSSPFFQEQIMPETPVRLVRMDGWMAISSYVRSSIVSCGVMYVEM
jgi:hypothetical protein